VQQIHPKGRHICTKLHGVTSQTSVIKNKRRRRGENEEQEDEE
jgi:hypothetical protein